MSKISITLWKCVGNKVLWRHIFMEQVHDVMKQLKTRSAWRQGTCWVVIVTSKNIHQYYQSTEKLLRRICKKKKKKNIHQSTEKLLRRDCSYGIVVTQKLPRNSCYVIVVILFFTTFSRNSCHMLQLFRAIWHNYSGVLQLLRDNLSVGNNFFVNNFCVHGKVVPNNFPVRKSCNVTTIPWFTTFTYSTHMC